MAAITRNERACERLVRKFIPTFKEQPLWRLQAVASETLDFLYGSSDQDDAIGCTISQDRQSEYMPKPARKPTKGILAQTAPYRNGQNQKATDVSFHEASQVIF